VATLLIPVGNGLLPRPGGGRLVGGFAEQTPEHNPRIEIGDNIFLCPVMPESGALYRIGVLAKIIDIRRQTVDVPGNGTLSFISVWIEGIAHARWGTLSLEDSNIVVEGLELQNFRTVRENYPVISGAGWIPQGGYTEFRSLDDIPVTVYGMDIERNVKVSLTGNLKGLVSFESAHTIEHAMIRSLRSYGLCTIRTLQEAIRVETEELTWSVEKSMRYAMPEVLGNTRAGSCGNPMTNMAHFYMLQEWAKRFGKTGDTHDFQQVRRTVMSMLTGELGLTTEPGLRAAQGLKKGMRHDDSPLSRELCKKILARFPLEPW
jgi:hypothetical protein